MVLMTGLDSIIESLYLRDRLTYLIKESNILVNPVSPYLIGKTIIINLRNYPTEYIDELISYNNTVISRFDINDDRVIVDPYRLRINENIIPLGKKINLINEEMYDKVDHIFDLEDMKLYYPKPIKCMNYMVNGNFTVLGYLAYQLGHKFNDMNCEFRYLDVIKLKNGIII